MILYLDSSALVKRFVAEAGSDAVGQAIDRAEIAGTVLLSRAEVAAALSRAVRIRALPPKAAARSLQTFRKHWTDLVRLPVTEATMVRAEALAWERDLRGYDAVHLATALLWQEGLGSPIVLATFDRRLWEAAGQVGLVAFPDKLPIPHGT